ncbi:MAG: hypothetical protein ACOCWA_01460 [Bacteroidota bacterium]
MRKQFLKSLILPMVVFIAGVTFSNCEKDNDQDNPQIGLKFNTITNPISLENGVKSLQQTKELAFHSGSIILSEVEFEVETDNDSIEIDFELEASTVVDFATGETSPDISFIQIPAGTYSEMEVEIELQDEDDNPSIVLYGIYTDVDGTNHDVRFEFNSGETFEVEREGSVAFSSNESVLAQITIDPGAWFQDISNEQLAAAEKVENVIVISENHNTDIFDTVADGLDLATEVEIEN